MAKKGAHTLPIPFSSAPTQQEIEQPSAAASMAKSKEFIIVLTATEQRNPAP
jgi:hypothetical protein